MSRASGSAKDSHRNSPALRSPGLNTSHPRLPVPETHARGERANATCKSCINRLSGYLDILSTNTRSLASIAPPDRTLQSSNEAILSLSSNKQSFLRYLYQHEDFSTSNPPGKPCSSAQGCAEPSGEIPAEGITSPRMEPLAPGKAGSCDIPLHHLKCISISISVTHLLAAKLERFLFFLLL